MQPALVTPPKVDQAKHGHALVKREGAGFICEACSSMASDMTSLSAIPCTPSSVFKSNGLKNINDRLKEEHLRLAKLRKLRLMELEIARLNQLKELQAKRTSNVQSHLPATGSALAANGSESGISLVLALIYPTDLHGLNIMGF